MTNIWPTLAALGAAFVVLRYFNDVPGGLQLAIIVGVTAGFFVAHNTWEEELCNCDDEDHDH